MRAVCRIGIDDVSRKAVSEYDKQYLYESGENECKIRKERQTDREERPFGERPEMAADDVIGHHDLWIDKACMVLRRRNKVI